MAGPDPILTEFGIDQRLENCEGFLIHTLFGFDIFDILVFNMPVCKFWCLHVWCELDNVIGCWASINH